MYGDPAVFDRESTPEALFVLISSEKAPFIGLDRVTSRLVAT